MASSRSRRHEAALPLFYAEAEAIAVDAKSAVAQEARRFRDWLQESDAEIESDFRTLAEDARLMELEEANVNAAWDFVASQMPVRASTIDTLANTLDGIETERSARTARALSKLLDTLVDVGSAAAGEIERFVEEEAHKANVTALANRRESAGLAKRLRQAEVAREKDLKARWDTGITRWRFLQASGREGGGERGGCPASGCGELLFHPPSPSLSPSFSLPPLLPYTGGARRGGLPPLRAVGRICHAHPARGGAEERAAVRRRRPAGARAGEGRAGG